MLPGAQRTWIVMLQGQNASVFESDSPGACTTRVRTFARAADLQGCEFGDASGWLNKLAQYLEQAHRENRYDRLALVGAAASVEALLALLSATTRALLVAKHFEDLSDVPPEELRWHMPASAAF